MLRSRSRFLLLALGLLTLASPAAAGTIKGKVVNSLSQGVPGVKVKFSGLSQFALTGPTGLFSALVPPGTYDVTFSPPTTALAPWQIRGVKVLILTDLGVIKLSPGFTLSGTVRTVTQAPVVGGDINVHDHATGRKLFTPGDITDAFGSFTVVVPKGLYDVRVRPALNILLVARKLKSITVNAATSLGIITLQPGVLVTGFVIDAVSRAPLFDVDLDADDAITGARIETPGDNTNALGKFSLIIPKGLFHLSFDPPRGAVQMGMRRYNVPITGTTNVGVTALKRGLLLSGTVLGPGSTPLKNADINLEYSPGGMSIFISNDKTDALGKFAISIAPGTYKVVVKAKPPTTLMGVRTKALTVRANTALPTFNLAKGISLSGTLTAHDGRPEFDTDIDVLDPLTGAELVTPGDNTDSLGRWSVSIPAGTWNVRFQTRKASLSRLEVLTKIAVTGPTVLNHKLSIAPIAAFIASVGIPNVANGGPVLTSLAFFNTTAVTQSSKVALVLIDPAGGESFLLSPLSINLGRGQFGLAVNVPLPLPLAKSIHLGKLFKFELRFLDPVTSLEQDRDRFKLRIR